MPLQKTRSKRKIKRKTQKKKRRSKKGGNPRQVALNVFNFLTKKLKRISKGKDNYDDHAATAQALEERIRTAKGLTANERKNIKNTLRNIGKRAVAAMRDPCLAIALMNQERCTSKQFLDGGTAGTYETIGFDKTCNINTLQRAIEGFSEHRIRSADTFADAYDWCANHVEDGMIKVRDKKERRQEEKHQELLKKSPSYRGRYEGMMTRLEEIKAQDNKAWGSGDLSVAQKKGRWDEDEQVTIGGKKKPKRKTRKRKHRKRKTKKRY